ncbi:WYL domain-containing protein [Fusobacterium simiae]|uniref:WYL domain-containing protein n=1 Tax=Fusobacterium simiae TaxID=855 RepID=A0ABT4DL30_FUSSI|nr:WYL domain-containing protein [Fusobacterium simiae]MCY7009188.1 WYL domain-containing protein [Fusobacterium simiae]
MKKIRVTVPEDVWDIMKIDQEDFGINNNKFCNYILEKLKFNRKIETEKLLQAQGRNRKKIIQFDLNVNNKEIYYDILKSNGVEIEAEYFRDLFEIYCSKFKYQRELFIYEDKLKSILDAIKEENKLKIKYFSEIIDIDPIFIRREGKGNENFLFCYVEKLASYQNYKLKELEIVAILPEKMKKRDKKFIESMKKKYDPFLGKATTIKVKLTTLGESLLKTFTEYRPKILKNEKNIFFFETTEEQAKIYFRGFLKEAEILEPLSLREEIKKEYQEVLNMYK